jgi:hypothetical protein
VTANSVVSSSSGKAFKLSRKEPRRVNGGGLGFFLLELNGAKTHRRRRRGRGGGAEEFRISDLKFEISNLKSETSKLSS